jgi:hypothetical protein
MEKRREKERRKKWEKKNTRGIMKNKEMVN